MNWAPFVSTDRVLVGLLIAAALIWSGVALTASFRGVDASSVNSGSSVGDLITLENEETKDDGNTATENARDTRSSPPEPTPVPAPTPEATLAPTPRPTPDDDDDDNDDNDGIDTPFTDNDGIDTPFTNTDDDSSDSS